MLISQAIVKLRNAGMAAVFSAGLRRVLPRCMASFVEYWPLIRGKTGLETGGPSGIFSRAGIIPIYPNAARIDNCTFSKETLWEGSIKEGATFHFDRRSASGTQYIVEANNLSLIAPASYDFLISSHVLEHIANPLQALKRVDNGSEGRRFVHPSRTTEGRNVRSPSHGDDDGAFDRGFRQCDRRE